MLRCAFSALYLFVASISAVAQAVPNPGENIASLVTFEAQADKSWGDDDFTQTFFFLVPKQNRAPCLHPRLRPGLRGRIR